MVTVALCVGFVLYSRVICASSGELHPREERSQERLSRQEVLKVLLTTGNVTGNPSIGGTLYDSRIPPDFEENYPTKVDIRIHLISFDSVSETDMHMKVELFLIMTWNDKRLRFSPSLGIDRLEVDSKAMPRVWVPDAYFKNAKRSSFHNVTVPNKYMHIKPMGKVEISMRLSLTLTCRMHLDKFPMDTQRCPMVLQSYTYTTENVMFYWQNAPGSSSPITFDKEIKMGTELPQFSIIKNSTETCQGSMGSTDNEFACIMAHFTLKRDISYYIIQVYVPGVLIVILSWVSFWLDVDAIPGRVSLGVLTVLTLNTHVAETQSQLPKVSYVKAIDVWFVTCLGFVFAAFLEFAYVNVLTRHGGREQQARLHFTRRIMLHNTERESLRDTSQVHAKEADHSSDNYSGDVDGRLSKKFASKPVLPHEYVVGDEVAAPSQHQAHGVDRASRYLFPALFIIFNMIYWIFYLYW